MGGGGGWTANHHFIQQKQKLFESNLNALSKTDFGLYLTKPCAQVIWEAWHLYAKKWHTRKLWICRMEFCTPKKIFLSQNQISLIMHKSKNIGVSKLLLLFMQEPTIVLFCFPHLLTIANTCSLCTTATATLVKCSGTDCAPHITSHFSASSHPSSVQ